MTSAGVLESTTGSARRRRGPRRILAALVVLVVLLAVLLGAGGWYYAGQIDSEALAAVQQTSGPTYDLVVTALAGGQVTIRRSGAATAPDPLHTSDVYGLVWPGGAGVLTGDRVEAGGGEVRRALQITSGTSPTAGTRAALDVDVWSDPQAAYGVPFENVSYSCAGGACPAWYLPGRSSTWMVLVHGKGAARTEPLRALGPALEAGLPALVIGYRNDPGAPADPSGRYGYGATEWHDLEQAVGYAVGHGAQHVVLFGSSMGGAIVASFLEHSQQASLVSGVVLDSPALDLRTTVDYGASQRTLPVIGTGIPDVLTDTAEWITGWRYGLDWGAVDYVPGTWLHVPALLFHGTADDTVPITTSDRLHAAHPDLVEEVRMTGATHVESWNRNPAEYTARESAFLGCVVPPGQRESCSTGN